MQRVDGVLWCAGNHSSSFIGTHSREKAKHQVQTKESKQSGIYGVNLRINLLLSFQMGHRWTTSQTDDANPHSHLSMGDGTGSKRGNDGWGRWDVDYESLFN